MQDIHRPAAKKSNANYSGMEKKKRHATSLALVDSNSDKFWMFEATPDIKHQLRAITTIKNDLTFAGIFLTHAHIGHYTGLMHLGHEAMGAKQIPVFTMPRMAQYLSTNGPWSQLVDFENISLKQLRADSALSLTEGISVTPFRVPHRDEFRKRLVIVSLAQIKRYFLSPTLTNGRFGIVILSKKLQK